MVSAFLALRVLEVKLCALRRKLDVGGDGSRDVVAALPALACFTGAMCEPLVIALHAFDGVSGSGSFIRDGVRAELDDANERLDGARFVDRVLECGGCGELDHGGVSVR